MIHVDAIYLFEVSLGLLLFSLGLLIAKLEADEANGLEPDPAKRNHGLSVVFVAILVGCGAWAIASSAYHSGQTYHPCKTDFSTMKQECR